MDGKKRLKYNSPSTAGTPADTEIGLLDLVRFVLERRRFIIGFTGIVCILATGWLLLTPNRYTSNARILPSGKGNDLASLGSMIGISVGMMSTDENSSALFPSIIRSRTVQDEVLRRKYTIDEDGETFEISLADYFGIDNPDLLRDALNAKTDIHTSLQTGEITIGVETKYPELSQAICQEYLTQLENFNRHKRASLAKENAAYLASQVEETEEALTVAELRRRDYRNNNLGWSGTNNPDILYEISVLDREVSLLSTKFRVLQEQYQMALLEAKKDVPIVRVLDRPSLPTFKSAPNRATSLVAVGLLAGFLSLAMAAVFGSLRSHRQRAEYSQLSDELRRAIPRPVRSITSFASRATGLRSRQHTTERVE